MTKVRSWLPALPCSPLNLRPFRRKKVALIGASMLGHDPPPLDDPDWDVWGCNSLWRRHLDREQRFRADAWWEMHPIAVQTGQELQDMKDCPVPLYILGGKQGLTHPPKHWMEYPLDRVREYFGPRDYFTNTFAYQIALAILQEYEEIGLWGVELWQGSTRETRVELPCLMYWLGLAIGHEIQITLPGYSRLLWHEHLYGYDYDEDVKQSKIDDARVAARWLKEQRDNKQTFEGAMEYLERFCK